MGVVVYRARRVGGELVRSDEHDAHAWWTAAEFRSQSTLTRLADAIDAAITTPGAWPGAPDDAASPGRDGA